MSTATISAVPFDDERAWEEFLGDHWLRHEALVDATLDAGKHVSNTPLSQWDSKESWMHRHQRAHEDLAQAWALDAPADLEDWDLTERDSFEEWIQTHADDHDRLEAAAGLE